MRNATPEEIQARTEYMIELLVDNPNMPQQRPKKKRLGPYVGPSKDEVCELALADAKDRWSQGTNHRITEVEDDLEVSDQLFFWDWKVGRAVGEDKFFNKLDKQVARSGLEVVHIPFDGAAYAWFLGTRI